MKATDHRTTARLGSCLRRLLGSLVHFGGPVGLSLASAACSASAVSPPSASVIGRASVVIAPTGYGLATYVASTDGEFDVLATPIACAMN